MIVRQLHLVLRATPPMEHILLDKQLGIYVLINSSKVIIHLLYFCTEFGSNVESNVGFVPSPFVFRLSSGLNSALKSYRYLCKRIVTWHTALGSSAVKYKNCVDFYVNNCALSGR